MCTYFHMYVHNINFRQVRAPQPCQFSEEQMKKKSTELLGSSPALQDGRYPYVAGYSSARRMACQTGSEGRLLHSTNPSGSLEVPSLRGGPGSLPIHMSMGCRLSQNSKTELFINIDDIY